MDYIILTSKDVHRVSSRLKGCRIPSSPPSHTSRHWSKAPASSEKAASRDIAASRVHSVGGAARRDLRRAVLLRRIRCSVASRGMRRSVDWMAATPVDIRTAPPVGVRHDMDRAEEHA